MDSQNEEPAELSGGDVTNGTEERRSFLSKAASGAMAFGLTAGYGMFVWLIGQFMYPFRGTPNRWQFLADLASFRVGESVTYVAPAGQKIVVTRLGSDGVPEDFIALSSVCPHLGCAVHWQAADSQFFCPCHNGAFSSVGEPLSGPPKDSDQPLSRYPLKVENDLLFIEAPTEALV